MSWLGRLFGRESESGPKVHLLVRGRIGEGWHDVDQRLRLPEEATLSTLLDEAERRGVPMRDLLEQSPHLSETLMWNGERCPVADHLDRPIEDGDQIYLLAPVAGGR